MHRRIPVQYCVHYNTVTVEASGVKKLWILRARTRPCSPLATRRTADFRNEDARVIGLIIVYFVRVIVRYMQKRELDPAFGGCLDYPQNRIKGTQLLAM